MLVFFMTRDLAVRRVASALGPVVPPSVVVPVPLASFMATLIVAIVASVVALLAFIFVRLPRLLEVPRDVAPTLHLIRDLFDVQWIRRVERVDVLVVGQPVFHGLGKDVPERIFEVVSR